MKEFSNEFSTERVANLINKFARQFAVPGHPVLDYDDLVSEGWAKFCEFKHKGLSPESDRSHYARFVASVKNRFIDLVNSEKVDTVEFEMEIPDVDFFKVAEKIFERELVDVIKKLDEECYNLLYALLIGFEALEEEVLHRSIRRKHLASAGVLKNFPAEVHVRLEDIRRFFGWTKEHFQEVVERTIQITKSVLQSY